MGMHIGLVAAKATVAGFRDAFSNVWPQLEVLAAESDGTGAILRNWLGGHNNRFRFP